MIYLFQVTIYTGLMLLLYILLLRNRPNHSFNRAYLLLTGVVPLFIPFLKLPAAIRPVQDTAVFNTYLNEVVIGGSQTTQSTGIPFGLLAIVGLYIAVVLIMLVVRASSWLKIRRLINASNKEAMGNFYLLKNTGYGPGSWHNYIFLPEQDADDNIIKHEQVHIELKHSRDLIFINMLQTFLWPNLFIHFIKTELIQIHEFQADAAVGADKEDYSKLLLSSVFGTEKLQLTHSFINHPIKRRIMMLYKNQTTGKQRGILASILSITLLAGIVTMQSCEQKKAEVKSTPQHDTYEFVEQMPEADYNVYEYLGKVTNYPKQAMDNGIQGKILIKFVVDIDGKISDAQISNKEYDADLGQAALDAVNSMPDWKPGMQDGKPVRVYYTLPIAFKLPEKDEVVTFEYKAGKAENQTPEMRKKTEEAKKILRDYNEKGDNPPPPAN